MSAAFPRAGLYVVTPVELDARSLAQRLEPILRGGAVAVQYRRKTRADAEEAAALRAICARHGAAFIVNDDARLARRVGADGVHVGREDIDCRTARGMVGAGAVVGVSCYDQLARARAAEADGADYVAFGRFFPSRTKPGASGAPLELLARARAALRVPIVAIGGVTAENAGTLIASGATCVAVCADVFDHPDPQGRAAGYARAFRAGTPGQPEPENRRCG